MKVRYFLSCLALLLAACKPSSDQPASSSGSASEASAPAAPQSNKPQVLVANYPLQYFAQRIGGDAVEVRFLAPKDEDPAFWQPNEAAIAEFQNAGVILMNGATYSKWADKVTLPEAKVVDTSASFSDSLIQVTDAVTHSHGPAGEHSHTGIAFTTWLDFKQASLQARAVRDALVKLVPGDKEKMENNALALVDELEALDDRMSALTGRVARVPLLASHPVYHYMARRYGLNIRPLLWEPETVPDAKAMEDLDAAQIAYHSKWMIWEGQPAKESVEKLEALGIKSLVFDPAGNVPDSGDFMSVMEANVKAFEEAFK